MLLKRIREFGYRDLYVGMMVFNNIGVILKRIGHFERRWRMLFNIQMTVLRWRMVFNITCIREHRPF